MNRHFRRFLRARREIVEADRSAERARNDRDRAERIIAEVIAVARATRGRREFVMKERHLPSGTISILTVDPTASDDTDVITVREVPLVPEDE